MKMRFTLTTLFVIVLFVALITVNISNSSTLCINATKSNNNLFMLVDLLPSESGKKLSVYFTLDDEYSGNIYTLYTQYVKNEYVPNCAVVNCYTNEYKNISLLQMINYEYISHVILSDCDISIDIIEVINSKSGIRKCTLNGCNIAGDAYDYLESNYIYELNNCKRVGLPLQK